MEKSSKQHCRQGTNSQSVEIESNCLKAQTAFHGSSKWPRDVRAFAKKIVTALLRLLLAALFSGLLWLGQKLKGFFGDFSKMLHGRFIRRRRLWRITAVPYRVYILSTLILFVWFFSYGATKGAKWNEILMYGGIFFYGIGFLAWLFPLVIRLADSRVGKLSLMAVNAFVLVFAVVYARNIACNALKLPPQNFELTVSFITLTTYVPIWLVFVSVFSLIAYALLLSFGMAVKFLAPTITSTFGSIVGKRRSIQRASTRLSVRATKAIFHGVGAAIIAAVGAELLMDFNSSASSANGAVKWFAYWADFYPSGIYPGVPKDARIRLLDNGVVSTARIVNDQVEITIANFED